jgi:hypothetical protein
MHRIAILATVGCGCAQESHMGVTEGKKKQPTPTKVGDDLA